MSDLDLYVVTREEDYAALFERREAFVRSWGAPVFLDETLNFEGLGWDMVHFVLADGLFGELALGHVGNFLDLDGGPHEVLVDKLGLLDGVTFPLYEPSEEERRAGVARALRWFWLDTIELSKQIARDRTWLAQHYLGRLRTHCHVLLDAATSVESENAGSRAPLLATFCRSDRAEIVAAAEQLVELYEALAPTAARAYALHYPHQLAVVAERRLRDVLAGPVQEVGE